MKPFVSSGADSLRRWRIDARLGVDRARAAGDARQPAVRRLHDAAQQHPLRPAPLRRVVEHVQPMERTGADMELAGLRGDVLHQAQDPGAVRIGAGELLDLAARVGIVALLER